MRLNFLQAITEQKLYGYSIVSSVCAMAADWLLENWYLVLSFIFASIIPIVLNIFKVRAELKLKKEKQMAELQMEREDALQKRKLAKERHELDKAIAIKKYNLEDNDLHN